jgi:hypothetical protein
MKKIFITFPAVEPGEGFIDECTREDKEWLFFIPPPTLREVLFSPDKEEPLWQTALGALVLGTLFYILLLIT